MISWFFGKGDKVISTFDKSKEDHFKALDLKMVFLVMTKSLICELILAIVSLWLLVNSIKKENPKGKCPINLFFIILFKDIFLIIILFFASF